HRFRIALVGPQPVATTVVDLPPEPLERPAVTTPPVELDHRLFAELRRLKTVTTEEGQIVFGDVVERERLAARLSPRDKLGQKVFAVAARRDQTSARLQIAAHPHQANRP